MADTYFLSCVTDELLYVREALWQYLVRCGVEPISQDYNSLPLDAHAKDIFERLQKCVKACSYRIYIIGFMSGWIPNECIDALQAFKIDGLSALSATQMEYLFNIDTPSMRSLRPAYVFFLEKNALRVIEDDNQQAFRKWIQSNFTNFEAIKHPLQAVTRITKRLSHLENHKYITNLQFDLDDDCAERNTFHSKLLDAWTRFCEEPLKNKYLRQILYGPAGVGKTHIAVTFGIRSRKLFNCAFRVTGNSPEELRTAFAELVVFTGSVTTNDEGARIELVQHYLNECQNWLLIMDSIDSPELWDCMNQLTKSLMDGCLIVTTRMERGKPANRVAVSPLEMRDALDFLQSTLEPRLYSREALNTLPPRICTLPVLLQILRKHLAKTQTRIDSFLTLLNSYEKEVEQVVEMTENQDLVLIAAFLGIVFDTLSASERATLVFLCVLNSQSIPLSFLSSGYTDSIPEIASLIGETSNGSMSFQESELFALNLIHLDVEKDAVSLHPVVSEAVVTSLALDVVLRAKQFIAKNLATFLEDTRVINKPSPRNLALLSDLVPHIRQLKDVDADCSNRFAPYLTLNEFGKRIPSALSISEKYFETKNEIVRRRDLSALDERQLWEQLLAKLDLWEIEAERSTHAAKHFTDNTDAQNQINDQCDRAWAEYYQLRVLTILEICDCLQYERRPQRVRDVVLRTFEEHGIVDLEKRLRAKRSANFISRTERLTAENIESETLSLSKDIEKVPENRSLLDFLQEAYAKTDEFELAIACRTLFNLQSADNESNALE